MRNIYLALMAVLLLTLSGCGGGSSSSGSKITPHISPDVRQVVVLSSPALERNKRYRIYTGAKLSGMDGAKYFISNTGSEAVQSTLNLGFSQKLNPNESFIIVNYTPDDATHSGSVVFAYDPSSANNTFISGGNIAFTGGNLMYYRTLSLSDTTTADYIVEHQEARPHDADNYARFESERGITTFAMGSGTQLSFVEPDEEAYLSRNIPSSGNVLQLVRKVNTFSGITTYGQY